MVRDYVSSHPVMWDRFWWFRTVSLQVLLPTAFCIIPLVAFGIGRFLSFLYHGDCMTDQFNLELSHVYSL